MGCVGLIESRDQTKERMKSERCVIEKEKMREMEGWADSGFVIYSGPRMSREQSEFFKIRNWRSTEGRGRFRVWFLGI